VLEVARGLAARGHEVHAVVHRARGAPDREERDGVHWHRIAWQPSHRFLRFRARRAVEALAESTRAEVVIERYYNFGGEGILAAAARELRRRDDIFFILVGGPRQAEARGYRGRLLGAVAYERMPELLAAADVGVAPYDTRRLRQLRLGFYWSPLKVFEYMASGLPVVTIARPPLDDIVRAGREGLHVREADPADLARALETLAGDAAARARMGRSGRQRVVERYSWARHCEQLEAVLRRIAS
jgi:hypothetical protein